MTVKKGAFLRLTLLRSVYVAHSWGTAKAGQRLGSSLTDVVCARDPILCLHPQEPSKHLLYNSSSCSLSPLSWLVPDSKLKVSDVDSFSLSGSLVLVISLLDLVSFFCDSLDVSLHEQPPSSSVPVRCIVNDISPKPS
jgi:hypothetical protein